MNLRKHALHLMDIPPIYLSFHLSLLESVSICGIYISFLMMEIYCAYILWLVSEMIHIFSHENVYFSSLIIKKAP